MTDVRVVRLNESQRIGFRVLAERVRLAQNEINGFIGTCLDENGGNRCDPRWQWNEMKLQWELSADTDPK